MADSRLTVRTLCLATVAFILACGHATRAMGQQGRMPDKPSVKSSSVIRVVPAGSGRSTVATITATSSSAGRGTNASRVATFTKKSTGTGSTVATFSGDRVIRAASAATYKPQPKSSKASRRTPATKRDKKDSASMVVVRRPGEEPESAQPAAEVAAAQPATQQPAAQQPATQQPVKATRSGLRNAFGGISSGAPIETTAQTFAHATGR